MRKWAELREGHKLYVSHLRAGNFRDNPDLIGGRTVATIKDENNEIVVQATARCHSKLDFFNKRLGREIAVGRAMKAYTEKMEKVGAARRSALKPGRPRR